MTVDFTTYLQLPHGERHLGDILNLTESNFNRYAMAIIEAGTLALDQSNADLKWHYNSVHNGCYAFDPKMEIKVANDCRAAIDMWTRFVEAWVNLRSGGTVKLRDILHGLALVTREAQVSTGPGTHCEYYTAQLLTWGWQEIITVSDEMEVYVV